MNYLNFAKEVLAAEARAIECSIDKLDESFNDIINAVLNSEGRVVLCGMGKSGHIAKKIFATLVSTGTPSMFMHPAEAFHGDLGMIKQGDMFVAISNSGETEEVLKLIPFIKNNKNTLISMTGNPESTLAESSHYHINVGVEKEACPLQLAPTSSTTVTLAMGDALAVALMKAREFKPENFARFHPGGALGKKLLGRVIDFSIPAKFVTQSCGMKNIITALAESRTGIIAVGRNGNLKGVITDGDIRRQLSKNDLSETLNLLAETIMTHNPLVVSCDTKCNDADHLMAESCVNSLLVKDKHDVYHVYNNLNR